MNQEQARMLTGGWERRGAGCVRGSTNHGSSSELPRALRIILPILARRLSLQPAVLVCCVLLFASCHAFSRDFLQLDLLWWYFILYWRGSWFMGRGCRQNSVIENWIFFPSHRHRWLLITLQVIQVMIFYRKFFPHEFQYRCMQITFTTWSAIILREKDSASEYFTIYFRNATTNEL